LNDRRPAWALPGWVPEAIAEALPEGWTLQVMETESDGSGDGIGRVDPGLLEAVADAEIYLGYGVPAALLRAAPRLRWAHSGAAGVGSSLTPEMRRSTVLFTNSKGIHGPPMGDTAMAMILHFARGLDFGVANKAAGRWDPGPYYRADHPLTEMAHSTVGIFGFGGIGREVAKRGRALGARILAFDRAPEACGDSRRIPQGPEVDLKDLKIETLHGTSGFGRLLEESDFLVLTAPDTPQTRGRFGASALACMKPTAVLINLSRGSLVEEDALVGALREERLRGAALDVFQEEPLPADHPFWTVPNLLLTPHVSAVSRGFWKRETELILENLRRYMAGEDLLNLVDKEAGF
jgi:phosphoglycerate dehydrogenase-like enzyme